MTLVDTHCHIDVSEFASDRDLLLRRARTAGVDRIVVPGVEQAGFAQLLATCSAPGLYPALGLHPVYLSSHRPSHIQMLEDLVSQTHPVAIGEVGLDYFIENADRKAQQLLFEAQVRIAEIAHLPLLLHIRKAHDDVLAILRRLRFTQGGIAHAFNGSRQQAEQFIGLGFKLGFGGVVTYERARKIRRLAVDVPISAIVLETDAPDLPPATYHGGRNLPEYLPLVLQELSLLRNESIESIAAATTQNALAVLPALA